jgi:hypothetical protein
VWLACVWTPRLLRRPRQRRRGRGLPHPGDPALVQGAAAHTAHLDADEPHRDSMATTRPPEASVPRHAVGRQNPRQEPSAVIPHAGICAGGRRQRRSLPRSPVPVDCLTILITLLFCQQSMKDFRGSSSWPRSEDIMRFAGGSSAESRDTSSSMATAHQDRYVVASELRG